MKKPGKTGQDVKPTLPVAAPRPAAKKSTTLAETTEGLPWVSSHEIKKETNPFTEADWRMKGYAWSGFAVRVLIVFGTIFTVFQYMAAREEKRVERTLQLIELWERSEYQNAQVAVKQRLSELNEKYAVLLPANPSKTELDVYYGKIGVEAMKAEGGTMPLDDFRREFDRVVYFLNRLAFCVDGNLCSQDMADAYFRDYAVSFWGYFAGYVAEQRKAGSTTFAMPIESYVRQDQQPAAAQ